MSNDTETALPSQAVGIARLVIGLAQGLALYLLYHALQDKTWPATDGLVFAPLLLVWLFVPLVALQGLGNLRIRTLVPWVIVATAALAGLGWYDIWAAWPRDWAYQDGWQPHVLPSAALCFFGAAGIFIAHALISGGDTDRRMIARYPTHFDVAWKLGIQLALSAVFVGIFWAFLELGAALFNLINLDFFEKLLRHDWFWIPATALAVAAAIHVTDVRAGLVRGTRTLVLVLLSWLLPLLALIVAGFLASLPFTGLAPLWKFGHASGLMLTAAALLIVLINAARQDGAQLPPIVLRVAGSLASFLLLPLAALAGYALSLRVNQYGWTNDRVATAACVVVAGFYASAYALSAIPRGGWLKRIETWNFYAALLVLTVLIALFTPLANPMRVSVADQVARLANGRTKPADFDFAYLRWSGGRYGRDALAALARTGDAFSRERATASLTATNKYDELDLTGITAQARMTVYPKGRSLPASFLAQIGKKDSQLGELSRLCLNPRSKGCDAVLLDIDGDGHDEVLAMDSNVYSFGPVVYRQSPNGLWDEIGRISIPYNCGNVRAALRDGTYTLALPEMKGKDIVVAGQRYHFRGEADARTCAK